MKYCTDCKYYSRNDPIKIMKRDYVFFREDPFCSHAEVPKNPVYGNRAMDIDTFREEICGVENPIYFEEPCKNCKTIIENLNAKVADRENRLRKLNEEKDLIIEALKDKIRSSKKSNWFKRGRK